MNVNEPKFVPTGHSDRSNLLLPAQACMGFVLEAETWPVFRAWLQRRFPSDSTDAEDRADIELSFDYLIHISQASG